MCCCSLFYKGDGICGFSPTCFRGVPPPPSLQPGNQEGGCRQLQGHGHFTDPLPPGFPLRSHCCCSLKHVIPPSSCPPTPLFSTLCLSSQSDFVTALLTILLGSFASGINPTIPIQAPRAPHEGTSACCPPCHCDPHPHWVLSAPEEPLLSVPQFTPSSIFGKSFPCQLLGAHSPPDSVQYLFSPGPLWPLLASFLVPTMGVTYSNLLH